jgi:hypothetical protein
MIGTSRTSTKAAGQRALTTASRPKRLPLEANWRPHCGSSALWRAHSGPVFPPSNGHQTHRHGCDEPTCKARQMAANPPGSRLWAACGPLLLMAPPPEAGTVRAICGASGRQDQCGRPWYGQPRAAAHLRCPIIEAILAAHSVGSVQLPLSVIHLTPSEARNPFRQRS